MKALVESTNFTMQSDIVPILKAISLSENLDELRDNMMATEKQLSRYVKYGFGSSHMWVADTSTNERLIFVHE